MMPFMEVPAMALSMALMKAWLNIHLSISHIKANDCNTVLGLVIYHKMKKNELLYKKPIPYVKVLDKSKNR